MRLLKRQSLKVRFIQLVPNSGLRGFGRLAALMMICMSFSLLQRHKTTIYLIGDSTMADKSVRAYPETGWGMPFHYFFDSTVVVDNRAQNGRSTRTFIEEGRWKDVLKTLTKGDYVLIEFGHNDEVPSKRSYTPQDQFVQNLKTFVTDTRAKGATPILLTPVARRHFDSTGKLIDTHPVYGPLVIKTAHETQVPLIDLEKLSMGLVQQLGPETSKLLYNQLEPGEHPHYPKGVHDDTHFNELGARKMAEMVLHEMIRLGFPVTHHLSPKR
jgi:lysophospholipase L1-like esterase